MGFFFFFDTPSWILWVIICSPWQWRSVRIGLWRLLLGPHLCVYFLCGKSGQSQSVYLRFLLWDTNNPFSFWNFKPLTLYVCICLRRKQQWTLIWSSGTAASLPNAGNVRLRVASAGSNSSKFFQITSFLHTEATRTNSPLKTVAGGTVRGLKCKCNIILKRICEQTTKNSLWSKGDISIPRFRLSSRYRLQVSVIWIIGWHHLVRGRSTTYICEAANFLKSTFNIQRVEPGIWWCLHLLADTQIIRLGRWVIRLE